MLCPVQEPELELLLLPHAAGWSCHTRDPMVQIQPEAQCKFDTPAQHHLMLCTAVPYDLMGKKIVVTFVWFTYSSSTATVQNFKEEKASDGKSSE